MPRSEPLPPYRRVVPRFAAELPVLDCGVPHSHADSPQPPSVVKLLPARRGVPSSVGHRVPPTRRGVLPPVRPEALEGLLVLQPAKGGNRTSRPQPVMSHVALGGNLAPWSPLPCGIPPPVLPYPCVDTPRSPLPCGIPPVHPSRALEGRTGGTCQGDPPADGPSRPVLHW